MSNVRMPIITEQIGEKTTKTCVEDVYKMVNRATEALEKCMNNSTEILDSVHKTFEYPDGTYEGELVIGVGNAQPQDGDVYNEQIGMEVAFRKAKLSANKKKVNLLNRVVRELMLAIETIDLDRERLWELIDYDEKSLKEF